MSATTSVVICTASRPDDLFSCLSAVQGQSITPDEILVVDNAPEDLRTRSLLNHRFPVCRLVSESRRGIPFARNRGIAESRGDLICFLDDDCIPVRGWLETIRESFSMNPQASCCTGRVVPWEIKTRAPL